MFQPFSSIPTSSSALRRSIIPASDENVSVRRSGTSDQPSVSDTP